MYYQPPRALGLLVGVALTLWSAGIAYLLFNSGLASGVGVFGLASYVGAVVLLSAAVLFAFWTYALVTLSYAVDRNGLLINWGPTRQVVPLGSIERLVPGTAIGVPSVSGVSWWGHHVGRARIDRLGEVLFYSTHQAPDQVLYVMTPELNYAISVEDPAAFAKEIQVRQDLGPTARVKHHVERTGAAAQPFWDDRNARLIALGAAIACLLVWLQVVLRYPSLPPTLDLAFPASRVTEIVTVSSREVLFNLPKTATGILVLNLVLGVAVHGWSRVAGYVLLGAALAVQIAILAATAIALA